MTIVDTNILYYKHKNSNYDFDISNSYITSINALEFLKNIEKRHVNRANYYIPLVYGSLHEMLFVKSKNHTSKPFNRRSSDSIQFDFKSEYESYVLYNNLSISDAINNGKQPLFNSSIDFLTKETYKDIRNKFQFILEHGLNCLPISTQDIDFGYILLDIFTKSHPLKDDFRNSWNDILILSKALNCGARLITEDKLLNKFASEIFSVKMNSLGGGAIEIDFSKKQEDIDDFMKLESKGYVNRGWQYKINNRR